MMTAFETRLKTYRNQSKLLKLKGIMIMRERHGNDVKRHAYLYAIEGDGIIYLAEDSDELIF